MKRQIAVLVAVAALVMGLAPGTSSAEIITSVVVSLGSAANTWCSGPAGSLGCPSGAGHANFWTLPGGNLNPSDTLILSQTGGAFSFDTSDVLFNGTPTITIGSSTPANVPLPLVTLSDTTRVLNPIDPVTNQFNEARNYVNIGQGSSFEVLIGYFDNIHTDACADTVGTISGNCKPDPVTVLAGLAVPAINNVFTDTSAFPNHCSPGGTVATCWDAGVIEIHGLTHAAPEPATLLLLGTGLIGLAAYGSKRRLKKSV